MSGSSSRSPVVTRSRRVEIVCPSALETSNPPSSVGLTPVTVSATIVPP